MTWKERWAQLKQNAKVNAVVNHVEANKKTYLVGMGGAAVGGGMALMFKSRPNITQINNTVAPSIAPVFNNDNSAMVNFGGTMSKIVKRTSDGKIWETVTEAATEEGVTLPMMSKHLNGRSPHIYGQTYEIIGLRTAG